jgi:hypothetical protein
MLPDNHPQENYMPRHPGLSQWHQTVSTYLSHLSQPQVTVLVLWRISIVLAQGCGLTAVAIMLAYLLTVASAPCSRPYRAGNSEGE